MAWVPGAVTTSLVILLVLCYNVNSITISPCYNNGVTRQREHYTFSSSCHYLSPNMTTVNWFLIPRAGQSVPLAMCSGVVSCQIHHPTISSAFRYTSSSTIYLNATREMAGTLVCSELFSNGTLLSDNCTLDVVYPFQVDNFSLTTNLQNWSLTAVFSTSKVFSTMGSYSVDITEYTLLVYGGIGFFSQLPSLVSETSLKSYTDKLLYYRGTLTVTWSLPDRSGSYYYLGDIVPNGPSLRIYPNYRGYFVISEPSPPTTNCPLTYVPEMGPITCMCSSKSLGTPPGRLQWLVGDDVIASGGYGVTQLQFPTNRVNRSHDGVEVTCQLDWVVKQHVTVASNVAYGPRDVSIQVISAYCVVMATCTVDEVKPFTPDMIQWGGLCRGHQGAVCVFTSRGAVDDGEEVTCTVINNANNGHSVTRRVNITLTDCVSTSSNPVKDTMATSVGASVGAALGVSVLVVCLVLVFLWIHRRHSVAETRNESVGSRKDCEENHYSGLFEGSSSETNQRNAKPSTRNPGFEPNVYHNT